jgi:hypothetical protein
MLCIGVASQLLLCSMAKQWRYNPDGMASKLLTLAPGGVGNLTMSLRHPFYLCMWLLQVLHLASVVAPNQDFTFCLSIIWCVVNFAVSSFFVNFNEVSGSRATQNSNGIRTS